MMNPVPPSPPSKSADRKALAAYYSELRRWAQALERWENDLKAREVELKQAQAAKSSHYGVDDDLLDDDGPIDVEEECDCTAAEAEAGCDCPACEEWRSRRVKKMMQKQQDAVKVGDELEWLENLWMLPDKRRKKAR